MNLKWILDINIKILYNKDMSFNHYQFHKGVDVYQNVFKDVQHTLSVLKKSEESGSPLFGQWEKWYDFGSILRIPKIENESDSEEYQVYKELHQAFLDVCADYIEKNNHTDFFKSNKWHVTEPSVCKYFPEAGVGYGGLAMDYHTDYQNEFEGEPGWKFGFTATMYLNDDYGGGEVDFYDGKNVISFKPKAGDITVFPSGSPDIDPNNRYMHGVFLAKDNPKYFVRMHYQYWKDGSKEYNDGLNKYGQEKWQEMLKEKYPKIRNTFHAKNRPSHLTERIVK